MLCGGVLCWCVAQIGGIVLLVLAIGAALGIATALGIALSIQIIQVLPFLVIGLGLTDMFVLMYTFRYNPQLSLERMASKATRKVGPSHLLITATSLVVFGTGSTLDIPVVRTFCQSALLAIVATYFVVVFGFVPILVLDARRIAAHRSDCLPCLLHAPPMSEPKEPRDRLAAAEKLAQLLAKTPVKAGVLVGFSALFVMSALNINTLGKVSAQLPANQFLPANSYVSSFYGDILSYYTSYPHSLMIGMNRNGEPQAVDYPNKVRLPSLSRSLALSLARAALLPVMQSER